MAKPSKASGAAVRFLVTGLGNCTPNSIVSILHSEKAPPDLVMTCALTFLCSHDPQTGGGDTSYLTAALDAVAVGSRQLAESALFHVARYAQGGRTRIEALRRLGRVARGAESRTLLRSAAKDGAVGGGDPVRSQEVMDAALSAIGELASPEKEDADIVFAVLFSEGEKAQNQNRALLATGTKALQRIARASDVERLLKLAEKLGPTQMALPAICVASTFPRSELLKHEGPLSKAFVYYLSKYDRHADTQDACIELARRLSCSDLVRGLAASFGQDCLENGRGRVAAAAMEAYEKVDDILVYAYLRFAQDQANTAGEGTCLKGLIRCAKANQSAAIVQRLVQERNPGYQRMLKTGALLPIAGGIPQLLNGLCEALDSITNQQQRDQIVPFCLEGLIRSQLAAFDEWQPEVDLAGFRQRSQVSHTAGEGAMERLVSILHNAEGKSGIVELLAERLVCCGNSAGALAMTQCMIDRDDALSRYFIEAVFRAASSLDPGSRLPEESNLARFEELAFTRCEGWLKGELCGALLSEGVLNHYVLDVVERRCGALSSYVKSALRRVTSENDAISLLRTVSRKGGADNISLLAEGTAFVSDQMRDFASVRKEALNLVETALSKDAAISGDLRNTILCKVHERFEDSLDVRLRAYGVAGSVADPRSIVPLRARLRTDSSEKAKQAISISLKSIRDRLVREKPAMSDSDSLQGWLTSVGDLGDHDLTATVQQILLTHSDRETQIAALRCLENLGDSAGVSAIETFIREMSPSGEVLRSARHAKAALQKRGDLKLLEVLARLFPEDSPVFGVDYQSILKSKVNRVATGLAGALEEFGLEHWDDFVTKLDALCDVLVRHVFAEYAGLLGLDQTKGKLMANQDYSNRLAMSQFSKIFPDVQLLLTYIHKLRYEATTAHLEDDDGTQKPGIDEDEAALAKTQFEEAFVKLFERLSEPPM